MESKPVKITAPLDFVKRIRRLYTHTPIATAILEMAEVELQRREAEQRSTAA